MRVSKLGSVDTQKGFLIPIFQNIWLVHLMGVLCLLKVLHVCHLWIQGPLPLLYPGSLFRRICVVTHLSYFGTLSYQRSHGRYPSLFWVRSGGIYGVFRAQQQLVIPPKSFVMAQDKSQIAVPNPRCVTLAQDSQICCGYPGYC